MRRTDAVVGVSKEVAETFQTKYPSHSGKVVSILNGVDVERFSVRLTRTRPEHVGASPGGLCYRYYCQFPHVKNHVCLVRAFRHLTGSIPMSGW